jgi:hypothetical protein
MIVSSNIKFFVKFYLAPTSCVVWQLSMHFESNITNLFLHVRLINNPIFLYLALGVRLDTDPG